MMDIAIEDKDYASRGMLQWFVNEQVEEEATMSRFIALAKGLEKHNIFMIENLVAHKD